MKCVFLALVVSLLAAAGCSDAGSGRPEAAASDGTGASGGTAGTVKGVVTVFAASSLTDVFATLDEQFRRQHRGTTVRFNFGSSSALAQQVASGAPADVFAAASPATMQVAVEGKAVSGTPTEFARNRLMIAVPAGNPGRVRALRDFADVRRTFALCAPQVPCGAASATAFAAAGVRPAPDSLERDVRAALSRVRLGEVDAALVYRTDISAARRQVEGIDFPEAARAINPYQIAVLDGAPNDDAAQAFVRLLLSPVGQRILRDAGFDAPAG